MQLNSVKDVMIFWRERQADKSLAWFANRIGVSASTIQRILDGGTKNPEFPTARSICLNALPQDEAFVYLTKFFPEKAKYIEADVKSFQKIQFMENSALSEAFKDFYKWQILYLASISPTPLTSFEKLGQVYSKKAMQLCVDGLLDMKNSQFVCKEELGHVMTPSLLTKSVEYIARSLREKSDRENNDPDGHIYFMIEGLSLEGKSTIRQLLLESCQKITAATKISSNRGENPVAVMISISDFI